MIGPQTGQGKFHDLAIIGLARLFLTGHQGATLEALRALVPPFPGTDPAGIRLQGGWGFRCTVGGVRGFGCSRGGFVARGYEGPLQVISRGWARV
jgi:hypothetical protein